MALRGINLPVEIQAWKNRMNEWKQWTNFWFLTPFCLVLFAHFHTFPPSPSPSRRPTDRPTDCKVVLHSVAAMTYFSPQISPALAVLLSIKLKMNTVLSCVVWWWLVVAENHQNPFFTLVGFCIGIIRPFWVFSFLFFFFLHVIVFVPPGVRIDCHCLVLGYFVSCLWFLPPEEKQNCRGIHPRRRGRSGEKCTQNTMIFEKILDEF